MVLEKVDDPSSLWRIVCGSFGYGPVPCLDFFTMYDTEYPV